MFGTTMPHQPWSPPHTHPSWKRGSKAMWTCWLPWDVWTTCTQRGGGWGQDWSIMIYSVSSGWLITIVKIITGWIWPRNVLLRLAESHKAKETNLKTSRLHGLPSCAHLNTNPGWYKWFTNIRVSGFWFPTSKSSLTGVCEEILGSSQWEDAR